MRRSRLAKGAGALTALARAVRGPGWGGRRARAWIAAVAAGLLAAAGLAAVLATPARASTPAPLSITTTTPLTATAGSAFLAKLDATGGTKPYTWSLAGGTTLPVASAPVLLSASPSEVTSLTANGGSVYWTDTAGQIMAAPGGTMAGTGQTLLANDGNAPAYLATDGSTLYWIDGSTDAIMAVPAAGGAPSLVANAPYAPSYLAVDG